MECIKSTESDKVAQLTTEYEGMIDEIVKGVQETPKKSSPILVDNTTLGDGNLSQIPKKKTTHLIVSVSQVKDGIEHVMR
jgi:hypothetical protein